MKPQHFAVVAGLLALTALLLMVVGQGRPGAAPPSLPFPDNRISVVGEGEVRVRPGLARLTFGVLTYGASAAEAEALNLASVSKLKVALVSAGVDEALLETTSTLAANRHVDFTGVTRVSGYEAVTRVTGLLRNPSRVQVVVEAALAAGATSQEETAYSVEDPEVSRQAAMAAALENARQRAEALATAATEALGAMVGLDVQQDGSAPVSAAAQGLVFRARVKVTYEY